MPCFSHMTRVCFWHVLQNLWNNNIGDEGCKALAAALPNAPLLELVSAHPFCSHVLLFDHFLSHAWQILGKHRYAISSMGLDALGKGLSTPRCKLHTLNLSDCTLDDAAIEAFVALHDLLKRDENSFDPRVAVRIKRGEQMTAHEYIELMNARRTICEMSNKISRNFDALLMPTVPVIAPVLKDLENSDDLYHQMKYQLFLHLN